jgi:hypothetical protein
MFKLHYFEEPNILFAHNQKLSDPRDGLALFGPVEPIYGIKSGVLSTMDGLHKFKNYLDMIQKPVYNKNSNTRPFFPGFETVFNAKWESKTIIHKEITLPEMERYIYHSNTHKRTYDLVSLFIEKIIEAKKNIDENIDVWFIVIPDIIYQYCRPLSVLPTDLVQTSSLISKKKASNFEFYPSFFDNMNIEEHKKEEEALSYHYDAHFRNQLKARLLQYAIPTQVIRESTLDWRNYLNNFGEPKHDYSKIEGHIAWTLSTAVFYKAGGKPWKLSDIRKGVCYLGLVYKKMEKNTDPKYACCAAQMFLDSGDGSVFKGVLGKFYNEETGEFHLTKEKASELLSIAIKAYYEINGYYPIELFIHAKTRFNDEEYEAFNEIVPNETTVVCITINKRDPIKLYRCNSEYVGLRGLSYIVDYKTAYLWTIGFVPHIQTSLSAGIPNALHIEINKGKASIEQVIKDILALTKLNYNACIYGDGWPVTLRFADNVGEILASTSDVQSPPLAFKYYI